MSRSGSPGPPPTSATEPAAGRCRRSGSSPVSSARATASRSATARRGSRPAVTDTTTSSARATAGTQAGDSAASSARTHQVRVALAGRGDGVVDRPGAGEHQPGAVDVGVREGPARDRHVGEALDGVERHDVDDARRRPSTARTRRAATGPPPDDEHPPAGQVQREREAGQPTIPAPRVVPVASSTTRKAPVRAVDGVRVDAPAARRRAAPTRPMSLSPSSVTGSARQRGDVDAVGHGADDRLDRAGRVLDQHAGAGAQRRVGHPADRRLELRHGRGGAAAAATSMSPRLTSSSSASRTVTAWPRDGLRRAARRRCRCRRPSSTRPDGRTTTSSPTRSVPLASVPA